MTALIDTIKADRTKARKDDPARYGILTVVLGEVERGTNVSDESIVSIIKKLIKSNTETIALGSDNQKLTVEKHILEGYLPQQMVEDEIRNHLLAAGVTNIKDAMAFMNTNFAGKFDRGLAAKIAKELVG